MSSADAMIRRVADVLRPILRFRRVIAVALQLALVALSAIVAFELRFDGAIPQEFVETLAYTLPLLVVIRGLSFIPFRLYQGLWRYTSIYDLLTLVKAIAMSSLIFLIATRTVFSTAFPRTVIVIDSALLLLALGGLRLCRRVYLELSHPASGKSVLIIGAGDAGDMIVREMKKDPTRSYWPIGFVDDEVAKQGRRIHGVPVLGGLDRFEQILLEHKPEEVLIAIPSADPPTVQNVVRRLQRHKIPIKTLPKLGDIIGGRVDMRQIRSLSVEDLLNRAPVGLAVEPLRQLVRGRRILVTGAGGSIGSELCRQLFALQPAMLVMLDQYENGLHAISMELADTSGGAGLVPVIADVTDADRMAQVFSKHLPEIVFHSAAHKHVPLMEGNPCEAIKNNVTGTRIAAAAADRFGADRFILISTDKAVNPTSVMGASKRVAELVLQSQAQGSGTSFATVRFGNVLGSNGSVVPRFLEQIRRGGPVTVTHPEIRRFFMLIPEAVQLVLHAAAQAESGSVYVLEMGEQVRLVDMAKAMIRLSGLVPDEDVQIEFVGLRPGEKLYEELVGAGEAVSPSAVPKVLRVTSQRAPDTATREAISALEAVAHRGDHGGAKAALFALVDDNGFAARSNVPVSVATATATGTGTTLFLNQSDFSEQTCPACASPARRSRPHGIHESLRKHLSALRPFRCTKCDWRGWLTPLQKASYGSAEADVNFASLDLFEDKFERRSVVPRKMR